MIKYPIYLLVRKKIIKTRLTTILPARIRSIKDRVVTKTQRSLHAYSDLNKTFLREFYRLEDFRSVIWIRTVIMPVWPTRLRVKHTAYPLAWCPHGMEMLRYTNNQSYPNPKAACSITHLTRLNNNTCISTTLTWKRREGCSITAHFGPWGS